MQEIPAVSYSDSQNVREIQRISAVSYSDTQNVREMRGIPAVLYHRMQNRSVPMTGATLNPDNKHSTRICQPADTGGTSSSLDLESRLKAS